MADATWLTVVTTSPLAEKVCQSLLWRLVILQALKTSSSDWINWTEPLLVQLSSAEMKEFILALKFKTGLKWKNFGISALQKSRIRGYQDWWNKTVGTLHCCCSSKNILSGLPCFFPSLCAVMLSSQPGSYVHHLWAEDSRQMWENTLSPSQI